MKIILNYYVKWVKINVYFALVQILICFLEGVIMSIFKPKRTVTLEEDNRIDNWAYMWMAIFMVFGYVLFSLISGFFGTAALGWFGAGIIAVLLISLVYSAFKKAANEKRIVHVILFISIILRLYYMIVTAQDVYSGADYEIIQNVCKELTLPEANQPLYYVMAAVLSNLSGFFSFTAEIPMEIVRLVTEYMGIVCVIAAYYILCELEANDTAIYIGTTIVAVHPGLIILGGQIGPNMLMTMFLMLTILYLIRWNNFTDGYNFLFMSVFFGLAALTSMSAFLFVPVVATLIIINLVRVFKRKQAINIVSTVVQTVAGLAAWLVLSFVYPVINIVSGKNTGIFDLWSDISSNAGSVDFNERFLSFSPAEMMNVFVNPEKDKNAWSYLIKSSLFGSSNNDNMDIMIMRVFVLISFATVIVAIAMLISAIFTKMDAKKKVNIWTLVALCLSVIVYYILFNLGRPDVSSMDFANIAIILGIGVAILGSGIKVLNNKKKLNLVAGILYLVVIAICIAFCAASVVYGILLLA